ncbi:FAD-dependent oxidoreductase [Alloacidobacterium sp.]|uniref:NAD(P)/FAD-dependent oxidoreductase n=1 Tax=Alloacidobacterium sp. TaxID=2951999 RepID=UPI002D605D07|nr:FAD-dependent oxidoreductase [Alloacidobacterium sp.]HYK35753.1 FAD-dependent oxidoreductase [Alloacidobacterium sp.]
MSSTYDVVVIGAGIVGTACALECANRGLKTAVVERDIIGGGATAAGMGHIVVMDDSPAQFALTRYSQMLWAELSEVLPAEVEYDACGTLWIARDDEEMVLVRRKRASYLAVGVRAEILDAKALAEAEPNLVQPLAGALLVPSDAVLYPPCAAGYLMREAMNWEVAFYSGRTVTQAGTGRVALDDGTELHAGHIVNACGADSPDLGGDLPIRKRKGHLVITERYPGFIHHQMVELGYLKSAHSTQADSVAFNVQPRKTGQVLIGSSRQFDVEDSGVNHGLLEDMVERAVSYLPGLSSLSAIRVWSGFRAATPDKLPLIGPSSHDPTVFLATGHEGLGITTSLATARLLADELMGCDSQIPIEPYLPERFAKSYQYA